MDVILLKKVQNLGDFGDKVSVKNGYGRNFLIPQGNALLATEKNLVKLETRRAELAKSAAKNLAAARARADVLKDVVLKIEQKAGEEGKLYGSVGTADIAEALTKLEIDISRQEIRLPEGAFRQLGEYEVDIHLHSDVDIKVKIAIVNEE